MSEVAESRERSGRNTDPIDRDLKPRKGTTRDSRGWLRPLGMSLIVIGLLAIHLALAWHSLIQENPTVDEVAHLPAGVTYWQTGTFRLYHHNPPLIKLWAAIPVLLAKPETEVLYDNLSWTLATPRHPSFAHEFAAENAENYLRLMTSARLMIPPISALGGLIVFLWARRLYGLGGGLISLTLYAFSPNLLAHARLVTTDLGAVVMGLVVIWTLVGYLRRPRLWRAGLLGLVLGLGCLTKFSLLIFVAATPVIGLLWMLSEARSQPLGRQLARSLPHGMLAVLALGLVINIGYGFEGSGRRLGSFPLMSETLTRPLERNLSASSAWRGWNQLERAVRPHRVNRFSNTWMGEIPIPLPEHFILGFDEQKVESEGFPQRYLDPTAPADARTGYPVYLDGELRDTGWTRYYPMTLLYKLPEGTWILLALSLINFMRRGFVSREELLIICVPFLLLATFTFATDINLGLRYILIIFPFLFILAGRSILWSQAGSIGFRRMTQSMIGLSLAFSVLSCLSIHPSYLAHFNRISGGADRGSEHLIDSNLDWGQDLVNLAKWAEREAQGKELGLAYFGQLHPNLLAQQGFPLRWSLPPAREGARLEPTIQPAPQPIQGPLEPGYYAVSASLLRGLPWRVYDSRTAANANLYAQWSAGRHAFSYFDVIEPIDHIGHSILIYRLEGEDLRRVEQERQRLRP